MQTSLPLNKMTINEKLVIMNQIWEDLMRNPEDIPSPEWHNEVLAARSERVKSGKAKFKDFDTAKSELRSQFK
jgi:hypothetical protein